MKIIKTADVGERRFRAGVYMDIFVPETDDLELDRESAKQIAEETTASIPNSYVCLNTYSLVTTNTATISV